MRKLPRHIGHFFNWYDTLTLAPLPPLFVSSVDSGNLVASLWALEHGCRELLHEPVIRSNALNGILDHRRLLDQKITQKERSRGNPTVWLSDILSRRKGSSPAADPKAWWAAALERRIEALREEARRFMPWCLPEYEALRQHIGPSLLGAPLCLDNADRYYDEFEKELREFAGAPTSPVEAARLALRLQEQIASCRKEVHVLAARLRQLASDSDRLAREMSFSPLIHPDRRLLSVGFDVDANKLSNSCYDLLASESRTAAFIAVARGEVEQDAWFRLGRQHTVCEDEKVLISWTGTMFEYLMPVIWMKSHPNTLLDRSVRSAVRAQRAYGTKRSVPWGISEAAYSKTDADGNYQYAAFGVPGLALSVAREGALVVSPYSSVLALLIEPVSAVANLRRMARRGWMAEFGFYESGDYTGSAPSRLLRRKCELVRCWMAHHQGMSLAAICNLLHGDPFQRWFHAERLVQASELILQERPLRVRPTIDMQPRRVLPWGSKRTQVNRTRAKPAPL
ncbi:MAG: hypothetical protein JO033_27070 [Acidobacteriaceae bacterium]|nr:hypothetical protein [Acidobacteriaceae bacterium]